MPAQSPTLSPTLSAMVAGLRGSSSGMPASTLPTRSAPTSAALVKMPPPTRRNRASSEPPNPKPTRIAEDVFCKIMMMIVAPKRPRPTVNMPATPPVRKATESASGSEFLLAAAAVRTLPRTARLMPMKPVRPDMKQPRMNASVRNAPDSTKERASEPSGFFTATDVTNTMIASGIRITTIVWNCRRRYAMAPSWIAWAISFIFGVPSSSASTLFMRNTPTARASNAVATDRRRMAHSPPWSVNSW